MRGIVKEWKVGLIYNYRGRNLELREDDTLEVFTKRLKRKVSNTIVTVTYSEYSPITHLVDISPVSLKHAYCFCSLSLFVLCILCILYLFRVVIFMLSTCII